MKKRVMKILMIFAAGLILFGCDLSGGNVTPNDHEQWDNNGGNYEEYSDVSRGVNQTYAFSGYYQHNGDTRTPIAGTTLGEYNCFKTVPVQFDLGSIQDLLQDPSRNWRAWIEVELDELNDSVPADLNDTWTNHFYTTGYKQQGSWPGIWYKRYRYEYYYDHKDDAQFCLADSLNLDKINQVAREFKNDPDDYFKSPYETGTSSLFTSLNNYAIKANTDMLGWYNLSPSVVLQTAEFRDVKDSDKLTKITSGWYEDKRKEYFGYNGYKGGNSQIIQLNNAQLQQLLQSSDEYMTIVSAIGKSTFNTGNNTSAPGWLKSGWPTCEPLTTFRINRMELKIQEVHPVEAGRTYRIINSSHFFLADKGYETVTRIHPRGMGSGNNSELTKWTIENAYGNDKFRIRNTVTGKYMCIKTGDRAIDIIDIISKASISHWDIEAYGDGYYILNEAYADKRYIDSNDNSGTLDYISSPSAFRFLPCD